MDEDGSALLLLPSPPQQPDFPQLRLALEPTIDAALRTWSRVGHRKRALLDIALSLTRVIEESTSHNGFLEQSDKLIFNFYRLLATIYTKQGLSVSGPGGLDTRVLLVHDCDKTHQGPLPPFVASIADLATGSQLWTKILSVESEEGEVVLRRFVSLLSTRKGDSTAPKLSRAIQRLPGGIQIYIPSLHVNELERYKSRWDIITPRVAVVVGGDAANHFTDMYIITMGLLTIQGRKDQSILGDQENTQTNLKIWFMSKSGGNGESTSRQESLEVMTKFSLLKLRTESANGLGAKFLVTFGTGLTHGSALAQVVMVSHMQALRGELESVKSRLGDSTVLELDSIEPVLDSDDGSD